MLSVLLILQLILSIILTVLVLLQRSEGGALGIGGGGGGGLMSGRSAATNIVRMTSIVGAIFIVNCVALTLVFNNENSRGTLVDEIAVEETLTTPSSEREDVIPSVPESSSEPSPTESDGEEPVTPPEPDDE